MQPLLKSTRILILTCCLFTFGASSCFAEQNQGSASTNTPDMSAMMNPMMGMMNPAMYMNMMNPMMGMMNPAMYMNMMNPMMGMMNPMMMGAPMMSSMMNPMMGMNMMYPMMGMMGPMMNPMSGMGMMPNTGTSNNNPMGQMMDPKQYENWFNQWTEMMNNMAPNRTQ